MNDKDKIKELEKMIVFYQKITSAQGYVLEQVLKRHYPEILEAQEIRGLDNAKDSGVV